MFFSLSWSQHSAAESYLILLYWEKVSGYLSQLHWQPDNKLLETLAKIRKINWLIKIGLVYGVEPHFQQYFSNDGQFYWWRKPEYLVKTTDLSQVAEKTHIMLHRVHLVWTGFELRTLVVIGTDCIGSYKSNYHTVTTTSAPITLGTNHLTFREAIFFSRARIVSLHKTNIRFYLH